MIDDTETIVLMKCVNCAFEDKVPDWVLDEMGDPGIRYEGLKEPGLRMYCPRCNGNMFNKAKLINVAEIDEKRKKKVSKSKKKKRW